MDWQKLFFISGTVFFILAAVMAILIISTMFGGAIFD